MNQSRDYLCGKFSIAASARDNLLVELYIQKETMMQLCFLLKAALNIPVAFGKIIQICIQCLWKILF